MTVPAYSSPYQLNHKAVLELFDGPVVVHEKIDGSQFSFHLVNGEVECRSKGAELHVSAPDKMFLKGVNEVVRRRMLLKEGYVYRGEYLNKPKHNVLAYGRVPKDHIILFDIEDLNQGDECYLNPEQLKAEAERIGLESVPTFEATSIADLRPLLDNVSILGGNKIEGVVVKNYSKFTDDKKVMMAKFVSEAFKEVHAGEWRAANPTQGDIQAQLIQSYRTPARWAKAVQHLREAGTLTESVKDIGALIQEVGKDIQKECEDEIKQVLFDHFYPQIKRGVVVGLPDWYKAELGPVAK